MNKNKKIKFYITSIIIEILMTYTNVTIKAMNE